MYKLTKKFTSRDGKVEVDGRDYGMSQDGLEVIGAAKPHLGGATHIFARVDGGPSNKVKFFTRDNQIEIVRAEKAESGWAEFGLEHGSAYNPDRGETGWWNAQVEGAPSDVATGLGLPYSWHVSTFLVFDWQEDNDESQPEEPGEGPQIPEEPDKKIRMTIGIARQDSALNIVLYEDGTYEMSD